MARLEIGILSAVFIEFHIFTLGFEEIVYLISFATFEPYRQAGRISDLLQKFYLDVHAGGVHLLRVEDDVSVLELLVDGAVGEAATADADALQHAVASQLMKHQSADELQKFVQGFVAGIVYLGLHVHDDLPLLMRLESSYWRQNCPNSLFSILKECFVLGTSVPVLKFLCLHFSHRVVVIRNFQVMI